MSISLPNYTLVERIHQGANAVLYRGARNSDGASVVIKLASSPYPGSRELARLRHEHGILRELDVPGVVQTHGLESFDRGVALILQSLDAEPLSCRLPARGLDLKTFLSLASSLAAALDALHQRHVLHKDIKPQNLLVTRAGEICLVDFGLAVRLTEETARVARPDALEGTLAYMSPEQTGRMNRVIDCRSDLYSAGVTLYEMLTGELPFPATDPLELVHSHIARCPVPPAERAPGLPAPVSAIVMKLLAKAAEDRYQTARGLKADLDECLRRWDTLGAIAPFALGQQDVSADLHIPQKLYGREAEVAELEAAFERVRLGSTELLLVAGYSGVGKSALVQEIYKPIADRGGYFISGKFDQYNRSVPYGAIARSLRELFRQLLTEPPEALLGWRAGLQGALGNNAQLLIDLIPELELVIGPQPPVQPLGASEAQNRFALVFQRFLQILCAPEHPLVLFLDDLQWADPASLKLLHLSLTSADVGHLLVIGAYRDNEVDAAHPLVLALEELRKAGAPIRELSLAPLELPHVAALLADTLHQSPLDVEPLARLVQDKTHGNPFFLGQILKTLHRDRLLTFDVRSRVFRWDLDAIQGVAATGNVIEFMAGKIERLGQRTQQALKLAACIGHRFDLSTLSVIHERPPREVAEGLWEALTEGLVLPLQSEYRLVHGPDRRREEAADPDPDFPVNYRFLHDRVQQAAYSLIGDAHRQEVHLKIGRLLLAQAHGELLDEQLFDIAGHLNRGAALITDEDERLGLARLNLSAGAKAKAATAYEAAVEYFATGVSRLSAADWEAHHELAFALHVERAQGEHLSGHLERAEALLEELLARALSRLERTQVESLRITLMTTQGRFNDALSIGRQALVLFSIDLPLTEEGWRQDLAAELAAVDAKLAGRRPADLMRLPVMTDPEMRVLMDLWGLIMPTAYFLSLTLFGCVSLKQVSISLEHGNCPASSYSYMTYGLFLADRFGRYEDGYAYGALALELNLQFADTEFKCKLNELFPSYLMFYKRPLRETLEYFDRAYQAGLSSGDLPYLSYTAAQGSVQKMGLGEDLGQLSAEIDRHLVLMQRTKEAAATAFLQVTRRGIERLTYRARGPDDLRDDSAEERALREAIGKSGLNMVASWYATLEAQILFLHERHADALAMAEEAEPQIASASTAHFVTDLPFYTCLILTALHPAATEAERARYDAAIARRRAQMARWAEGCPENFQHKLLLIQAEQARLLGSAEAVGLYERAIEAARANGFVHHEALANELCAKFYLGLGSPRIAAERMTAARAGYLYWGAVAKVAQLEDRYAGLLVETMAPAREATRSVSAQEFSAGLFDIAAVLRAAQAIASEIVLPRVVDRLMRIVLVNAGAQWGALILHRDEQLVLEATLQMDAEQVEVGIHLPIEARDELPRTVLHYVARAREPVVVADAESDARFAADPVIAARRPRSILCMPLLYLGRLTGMIYLEHGAMRDVFTPARVEVLGVLCSQTAIALENAALLASVEAATCELREANQELSSANARLQIELAERARVEEERAALQEQIIAAQQDRMAEMSTPFLPITEQIMVMPLVGTLDSRRAEQMIEVALQGSQRRRAKVVILDITGIKRVDNQVADMLLRTASALRLLGTEAILTGLRPEIAQVLVPLGVDLGMLTTHGTLQSAVAYALTRAARRPGRPVRG